MLRTSVLAAATVALLGGTALAQPAGSPPANLSQNAAPNYNDDDQNGPPPPGQPPAQQASADQMRDRDMFCRRDAAARTGYTTPGQAARNEQAKGTVGGTLGGAALGAIIGAGAGNAGLGAAAGAGAGLLAGTAIGANNADQAARDVQNDYGAAYYACMHEASAPQTAGGYNSYYDAGYPPPPPPPGYYGYPAPYYPYYYGPAYYGYGPGYYGPGISLGFGFGGGWHHGWGGHGWHH